MTDRVAIECFSCSEGPQGNDDFLIYEVTDHYTGRVYWACSPDCLLILARAEVKLTELEESSGTK